MKGSERMLGAGSEGLEGLQFSHSPLRVFMTGCRMST